MANSEPYILYHQGIERDVPATSHLFRRTPRPPTTGRRDRSVLAGGVVFLGGLLRGLLAAVVLAALVVGLPWALVHYVGWPLPHHVPTGPALQGFLLGPMNTTFLLDFLACACWIAWFAFTLDIARCTADIARGARWPDLSAASPFRTLAAVLVGAVLLSVLGNRSTPAPSSSVSTALGTGSPAVAGAPAWQHTTSPSTFTVRQAAFTTSAAEGAISGAHQRVAAHPVSVIVRAPANGVHDSLWRIAQRTLGDGTRWPEIFRANEGMPQPGGATCTQPSLIYPGQQLDLPADPAAPPAAPAAIAPPPVPRPASRPATSPPTTTPPPVSSTPATPVPTTNHGPTTGTGLQPQTREPGFRREPDLFVGLGLAAAVSTALLAARRRYRARYRPGSGDRDDFPVAPAVYQLRLAHLRAELDDEIHLDGDDTDGGPSPRGGGVLPARVIGVPETGSDKTPALAPPLGVRDGREIALNLAVARGLGLVGAGSPAATRALLITALSTTAGRPTSAAGTRIVVPAPDLVPLLGSGAAHMHLPPALCVADSLHDALNALEAEILVRAGTGTAPEEEPRSWPPVVLATTVPQHQRQRLQGILDNGSPFGITGLLLGQWQPGVTAYVRPDGTVSATGPGLGEQLRGSQLFHLGDTDTAALLELLCQADPEPGAQDRKPAAPRPRRQDVPPATQPVQVPAMTKPAQASEISAMRPSGDAKLEVTSAVEEPLPTDTALEIIAPHPVQPPGIRLRANQTGRQAGTTAASAATPQTTPRDVDKGVGEETTTPTPTRHADTAALAAAPIRVAVLGAPRVFWRPDTDTTPTSEREVTGAFQPRIREFLVFLAVHPGGASREAVVAALWPDTPTERSTNSINTALSRLRRAVSTATSGALPDIVVAGESRYQLDPTLVDVDYWHFDAAMAARRTAVTDPQRVDAYRAIVDSYGGALADGMSTEWIETAREAIRRDAIDAVAALARALVADDPQQTLDLLEVARAFDPHNESLYRDIMRLQERLGQIDAIARTLTLLTTRLAEIDNRPTAQAISLATRLRQRHDERTDDVAGAFGCGRSATV